MLVGSTGSKFMHTRKEQGAEMQAKRRTYEARSSSKAGEGVYISHQILKRVSDQIYTTWGKMSTKRIRSSAL